ncbi:MAG: ATPase V [Bacteroidales bacterium]|nr:ATPase V [Bacteroidales bacterium]
MIDKMTRYSFILLSGDKEEFLEKIKELGVVDITRSTKPIDSKSSSMLADSEQMKSAIAKLSALDGEPTGKVECDDPVQELFTLSDKMDALLSEENALQKELAARKPWGDFDPESIKRLESLGIKVRFYKVATKRFDTQWELDYPLSIIAEEGSTTYFVTASDDPDYNFPLDEIEAPEGNAKQTAEKIAALEKEIISTRESLTNLKASIPEIEEKYRKTLSDLDMYFASSASQNAVEDRISLFEGYAPVENDEMLVKELDKMDVHYIKEEAKTEDNPPIRFKNNKFVKMFEVLTDMYGRPDYNGFDPTPFIAIFFLLFFAFCMGDAGYGLVLILVGFALKKVPSFKDMSSLVVTLGIGTAVIGFLFHTFFSMDISTWECIPEGVKKIMLPGKIAGYDGTMVLALIVGIVHLCLAMVVKTVNATRNNGFLNSLATWGWTLLIVGSVIVGTFALIGVLDTAIAKWIIIGIGIVSALGIFIFNDIHRNPLLNIGSGLWDTYNTATGLLGDVLSYLRLYALGLAGGMLGLAFNNIGGMVLGDGSNVILWIPFILIVLVGHVLNIAMCALGAFVHPLRLNFLEFFKNSGYEANGRNYNPLGAKVEQ